MKLAVFSPAFAKIEIGAIFTAFFQIAFGNMRRGNPHTIDSRQFIHKYRGITNLQ
jgi:hypothetical protein